MRITGGMFRGRRLETVPAAVLRPTQDRVREALFSTLAGRVPGCAFLDLYAGTGSVGLEAWSRGAVRVVWVERNRQVFRMLERNVRTLAEADPGVMLEPRCLDVRAFCRRAAVDSFDVVYADPPYARNRSETVDVLAMLASSSLLRPDGIVVFEQGADELVPTTADWVLTWERRYGGSVLRIFQREGA